jgi:hypothetical protein
MWVEARGREWHRRKLVKPDVCSARKWLTAAAAPALSCDHFNLLTLFNPFDASLAAPSRWVIREIGI